MVPKARLELARPWATTLFAIFVLSSYGRFQDVNHVMWLVAKLAKGGVAVFKPKLSTI